MINRPEGHMLQEKKLPTGSGSVDNTVFRLARYGEINGMPVAGTAVISYGQQKITGDGIPESYNREASGEGDLGLHAVIWPINDPLANNFLAIHAAWILPTGQYQSSNFLNIGENRHRGSLSFGWIHSLGEPWTAEVIGELGWYGANDDFGSTRKTQRMEETYSATTYLRYGFGAGKEAYLGYQWNRGGETSIDSIPQNDPFQYEKAMIGFIYPVSASSFFNFRFGQDRNMQSGFAMEREITVRWLSVF